MSLLQHILGQAVVITQINLILVDAVKIEDWETFFFILGRMIRMVIIVTPLEREEYEDDDPFDSADLLSADI